MDYKEIIERCLGDLEGQGARLHRNIWRHRGFELVGVDAFVDPVGIPWDNIKHLYKGDLNHLEYTDIDSISDINDGTKHRWVSTVPIKGNDPKYGRAMFCLKTGILRNTTMGEFYGSSTVD